MQGVLGALGALLPARPWVRQGGRRPRRTWTPTKRIDAGRRLLQDGPPIRRGDPSAGVLLPPPEASCAAAFAFARTVVLFWNSFFVPERNVLLRNDFLL